MKNIDKYADWTLTVWFSNPKKAQTDILRTKPRERDLTIMSLGLAGECGEVMEVLKKRVRDKTFDQEHLKKELGDVIYYWARLCKEFGLQPSDVLKTNVKKIEGRRKRRTMRGSGDDR